MALWFCLWFCPFTIETTFPLFNFKTKHIFGILMTLRKFLKLRAPKAAQNGHRRRPKRGADGAVPPEDERNPAEGEYFASVFLVLHYLKISKKKFHQIDLKIINLPNITENLILINFYLYCRPSKACILWVA